jgi:hypothetical protein
VFDSPVKDPSRISRGKKGAAVRWGGQRIVRLDSLSVPARAIVLALIAQLKSEPTSISETFEAGSAEVVRHDSHDSV